jgi:hypothetical protein
VRPDPRQAGGGRVQRLLQQFHSRTGRDTCQSDGSRRVRLSSALLFLEKIEYLFTFSLSPLCKS